MKKTYNYNGQVYNTISAIAKEVGKKRLYERDFAKYGITVNGADNTTDDDNTVDTTATVTVDTNVDDTAVDATVDVVDTNDDADDTVNTVADDATDATDEADAPADNTVADESNDDDVVDSDNDNSVDDAEQDIAVDDNTADDNNTVDTNTDDVADDKADSKDSKKSNKVDKTAKAVKKTGTDADIEEVEKNVVDMSRYSLGKEISGFTMEALVKLAQRAGVTNLWEHLTHEGIRRMRLVMEIKEAYFPSGNTKKAAASTPWKGIATEDLVKKAQEKSIAWKETDNDGINRMRVIMALKAAGVQATGITA